MSWLDRFKKKPKEPKNCSICKNVFTSKPAFLKMKTLDGVLELHVCPSCESFLNDMIKSTKG